MTTKAQALEGINASWSRKIDNNTFRYTVGEEEIVRLHNTDILTFRDGGVEFNTGGWFTVTTKQRMNEYQNIISIWQERGTWYFCLRNEPDRTKFVYRDGMWISHDGIEMKGVGDEDSVKRQKKMTARINKFVNLIDDVEKVPQPDGGDCWHCSMFDRDKHPREVDSSHILSHVMDGYLHGSLLYNAMRYAGWRDHQLGFCWNMRDTQKRALRKYLKAVFGQPS